MVRTSPAPVAVRCAVMVVILIAGFASGCSSDGPPRHWPTLSGYGGGPGYDSSPVYSAGGSGYGQIGGGAPELLFLVAALGIGLAVGAALEGLRRLFSYSPT